MVVRAEDVPSLFETLPEPLTSRQTDPLETSLVESGSQLLSLNPFEEEEEMVRPTSTGAAQVISQTIHVESTITKPQKIIGGLLIQRLSEAKTRSLLVRRLSEAKTRSLLV